jgi:site-specific DNA recombinase
MSQRAALYARVSTARQEQEQTVASQLEALENAATAMGLTVPAGRRYIDDGISGARLDRPGLDALRDAAADGLIDVVLVHAPDRLARNYVHQVVLVEELTNRGVHVHFVECPATERAEDRLLVQMQGIIAEYERAKIMERTRRGRIHKLRAGQMLPYSSVARYGYAIERSADGLRRTVVIDEVEAQHVRAMYRWVREEDLSSRAVARRLNAQGDTSSQGGAVDRGPRLWGADRPHLYWHGDLRSSDVGRTGTTEKAGFLPKAPQELQPLPSQAGVAHHSGPSDR